jgi:hypothetical protein
LHLNSILYRWFLKLLPLLSFIHLVPVGFLASLVQRSDSAKVCDMTLKVRTGSNVHPQRFRLIDEALEARHVGLEARDMSE